MKYEAGEGKKNSEKGKLNESITYFIKRNQKVQTSHLELSKSEGLHSKSNVIKATIPERLL